MNIQPIFQTLHDKTPKLGQIVSLFTASSLIFANSVIFGLPLLVVGLLKVATQNKLVDLIVIGIARYWIGFNNFLINTVLPKKDWRIDFIEEIEQQLDPNKQYLLICNHQSWIDTSVVQYASHYPKNRLPLTRFFTKFELIYIPFVGQAFYFLDFPMMKRHSKKAIAKNPSLKGKDIEEAKRACDLLRPKPFTLLNYLEGTRFNLQKKQEQDSPYQYLLKPKAGGLSLAISALGEQIDGILDMTIVYPDYPNNPPSYDQLWRGNIKRLGVEIRHLEMPETLFNKIKEGGYNDDMETKEEMFAWIETIWKHKDNQIKNMLKDFEND